MPAPRNSLLCLILIALLLPGCPEEPPQEPHQQGKSLVVSAQSELCDGFDNDWDGFVDEVDLEVEADPGPLSDGSGMPLLVDIEVPGSAQILDVDSLTATVGIASITEKANP